MCDRVLGSAGSFDDDGEFERTELEGRTCFVRLTADRTGQLVLESARSGPVSYVSTLPWALGQLERGGLASLSSNGLAIARENLADVLLNFHATRKARATERFGESSAALTIGDILELHRSLQDWAGFSIPNTGLIGIQVAVTEKKKKQTEAGKDADDIEAGEARQEASDSEIAILNSFYMQDIEKVIKSIRSGEINSGLKAFLSPLPVEDRTDLESASGLRILLETLHPTRLNRGRWLSDAGRSMSLMQQFAINVLTEGSANVPRLFSINGPPGTGKTTLLQDVFADSIVKRARVLAGLSKPSSAFLPERLRVAFKGGKERTIAVLKPALTGFEMVVASSNNAAVENISGDLPKAGKLGPDWQESAYLKPVSYKIAAQKDDGTFKKLRQEDVPWGLISCALGNSKNRRNFKERFCYMEVAKNRKPTWQFADRPQNVREWIDRYAGPDFASAKRSFLQKDKETEEACLRLKPLADLLAHQLDAADECRISAARQRFDRCSEESSKWEGEMQAHAASIERLEESLRDLTEEERLLDRSRPLRWARLLRTQAAKLHRAQVSKNASAQLEVRRQIGGMKEKVDREVRPKNIAAADRLRQAQEEMKRAESEKREADERFKAAKAEFGFLHLPDRLEDLQTEQWQIWGLWRDEQLAQKRSELFAAALSLHEAWLASVGRPKAGFRPNILAMADLLSGRRLEDSSDALPIWQSLFLMVPVVSTTFASFHNQFGNLESASLGWLFIDEAGQAVPQAAVGAIWRAKRAVVIGDPLQIEPVFTLPSRFISAVAELSPYTAGGSYSPHKTSVQALADRANRLGVLRGSESNDRLWVGSPLRVHRRCIDPMFSWSNSIAYQGKMVFGLRSRIEPDKPPIAHESAWIDIKGNVRKRQEVVEQTDFVAELIIALYRREGKLPGIYLISPFKAIKSEMTKTIMSMSWVDKNRGIDPPPKQELKKWCKERVGTVHTFQGKEEDTVVMVLGADAQHAGSAEWACAKPNILNVALTRARRRFYVVGDRGVWGTLGPFLWAVDCLPTTSADQFLSFVLNNSAVGQATGQ